MNFEGSENYVEESNRVDVHRLGKYSSKKYFKHDGRSMGYSLKYASQLSSSLKNNSDYDAVIFGEWNLLHFIMSKNNVPKNRIVDWCEIFTGSDYLAHNKFKKFGEEYLERMMAKGSDHNIAVNAGIKDLLNTNLNVPSEKIKVVRNGVDESMLLSVKPQKSQKKFLYIGRIARHKQVDILIKAFRRVNDPDVELTIVGDGSDTHYLKYIHEISREDSRITLKGNLTHGELLSHYREAGYVILPSLREGTGLVILEGFANYTPAITIRAPLNHSVSDGLAEDYNGFVSENSIVSLTEVIEQAASISEDRYDEMCVNARESVSGRTWNMSSDEFQQVILKLVANDP